MLAIPISKYGLFNCNLLHCVKVQLWSSPSVWWKISILCMRGLIVDQGHDFLRLKMCSSLEHKQWSKWQINLVNYVVCSLLKNDSTAQSYFERQIIFCLVSDCLAFCQFLHSLLCFFGHRQRHRQILYSCEHLWRMLNIYFSLTGGEPIRLKPSLSILQWEKFINSQKSVGFFFFKVPSKI